MTRRALLVCLAALVVLRLVVVASVGDVFGYGEEFGKGAAAKAMLDGLPVEHHELAYAYHEGGGFAVTHLKALLFALMGPSVLANKVAAILMCTLLLWAGIVFAREHLGARTAIVFAALFVLAPFNFVRFSLLNLGTHFEALIFVVLVLHFAMRVGRAEGARVRDAVWLGLSGGFGLWFSLQLAPALLAAAVWILVRWRGRLKPRITLAALGAFAAGALPLWIMLVLEGRAAVTVRGHDALAAGPTFFHALFGMLAPIADSHDFFTWVLAFTMLIAIGASVLVRGTAAHTLSFLYIDIYAIAYAASGLAQVYLAGSMGDWFFLLRLAPFWFFATMFSAHGVAALWEEGGLDRRIMAGLALGVMLLCGVIDFVRMCDEGRPRVPLQNLRLLADTKGYAYSVYIDKFQHHLEGTPAEKCRVLLAYEDDPRTLCPAIAHSLFENSPDSLANAVAACRAWFGADASEGWRGLGQFTYSWNYDVPAAFARIEKLPEDARAPLAEALGRAGLGPNLRADRLAEQLARPVPPRWRDAWLRGAGWRIHFVFRFRPDLAREFIEGCDVTQRIALQQGWDEARNMDSLGRLR